MWDELSTPGVPPWDVATGERFASRLADHRRGLGLRDGAGLPPAHGD